MHTFFFSSRFSSLNGHYPPKSYQQVLRHTNPACFRHPTRHLLRSTPVAFASAVTRPTFALLGHSTSHHTYLKRPFDRRVTGITYQTRPKAT